MRLRMLALAAVAAALLVHAGAQVTAAARARQDLADAQELENEALTAAGLPDGAGAALFARRRAQELRQEAASLVPASTPAPTPAPPTPPAPQPAVAPHPSAPAVQPQPPAPTSNLHWTPWDPVASCSGIDVSFGLASPPDGGERVRMEFENHNPYATVVSFRTVYLGRRGERQPAAGDSSITIDPGKTAVVPGEQIQFIVAQYGLSDMTVHASATAGGVANMSMACAVRLKRAPQF